MLAEARKNRMLVHIVDVIVVVAAATTTTHTCEKMSFRKESKTWEKRMVQTKQLQML